MVTKHFRALEACFLCTQHYLCCYSKGKLSALIIYSVVVGMTVTCEYSYNEEC